MARRKSKVPVLLTQPVEKLGEPGDVVEVAPGYARNYLLPKGLAVELLLQGAGLLLARAQLRQPPLADLAQALRRPPPRDPHPL